MSASFEFLSHPCAYLEQGALSLVKGFFGSALGPASARLPPTYTLMFAGAKRAEERDFLLALCQVFHSSVLFLFFILGKDYKLLLSQSTTIQALTLMHKQKSCISPK